MNTYAVYQVILKIDKLIDEQLHQIMNATPVIRLRAAWCGLHFLMANVYRHDLVKIKLLNVSWAVLCKDLQRSADVEQCYLYDKINYQEFGMPGGEPFSLLIGHYYIDLNQVTNSKSYQDLQCLQNIARIAAASFTLFVTGMSAHSFGLSSFQTPTINQHLNIDNTTVDMSAWQRFRNSDSARFIGFVLPNVLLNHYYYQIITKKRQFYTHETFVWGHAIFSFAQVFLKSYLETGWFLDALGIPEQVNTNKKYFRRLQGVPFYCNDLPDNIRPINETLFTAQQEQRLNAAGISVFAHTQNEAIGYFSHSPSAKDFQQTQSHISEEQLTCLLQYLLCVCRFAHYLKIIGRNKIGHYKDIKKTEKALQNWLNQYIASNDNITRQMKSQYPLKSGTIKIILKKAITEQYVCLISLSPQLRTNDISTSIHLQTVIAATR